MIPDSRTSGKLDTIAFEKIANLFIANTPAYRGIMQETKVP